MATWGNEDKARIAGFHNPSLKIDGLETAFFGYFESVDSSEICNALFVEFENWARALGVQQIFGPVNFSTYGMNRIRIGPTPTETAFPGEPYNPDYYAALFESNGYTACQEYVSQFGNQYNFDALGILYDSTQEKLKTDQYREVTFNTDFWMARRETIFPIFQSIWKDNFGYVPINFETFCAFFGTEASISG